MKLSLSLLTLSLVNGQADPNIALDAALRACAEGCVARFSGGEVVNCQARDCYNLPNPTVAGVTLSMQCPAKCAKDAMPGVCQQNCFKETWWNQDAKLPVPKKPTKETGVVSKDGSNTGVSNPNINGNERGKGDSNSTSTTSRTPKDLPQNDASSAKMTLAGLFLVLANLEMNFY